MNATLHPVMSKTARLLVAFLLMLMPALSACGGSDAEGVWVHDKEGTLTLDSGGIGEIKQGGNQLPFEWKMDGDTVQIIVNGNVEAEGKLDGDTLTFRPGDFSGDEPVVFHRK